MSNSLPLIKEFVASHSNHGVTDEEVARSRNLVEDDVIDSLGLMLLVDFLSDRFSIDFEPEEVVAQNFRTLETIAALVDRKREAKG